MIKTVVTLKTKEQADDFFQLTGFPMPSCGCTRTNWDYRENTSYNIEDVMFGNINYFKALNNKGYEELNIISYSEFMESWNKELVEIEIKEPELV